MNQEMLKAVNAKLNSDFRLIKQFGNGNSNKNYLLENSKKEQIVVKQLDNQPVKFVPIEISIQKHLAKNKLATPQLQRFGDKPDYVLNIGEQNLTYTKYIDSDESLPTPFELGVNIARFQTSMTSFKAQLQPNWLHPLYWKNLKFKSEDLEIAKKIKNDLHELRQVLTRLKLPQTVIHGDLNLGNYLTLEGKIVAVLDLESTERNFRLLDIGMTIFQVKPEYKNLNYSELAKEVIKGYESLIPLEQKEKEEVLTATLYSASASGLWNLSFEGDSNDFLESYTSLIGRIKDGFK